jgi:DNA-binding response OmpR family regulator
MKVLIVEDENEIVEFLIKGLACKNFTAEAAYDGIEGVNKATSKSYDIILLDLLLPRLDGIGVLKELRSRKINTPVIALTAIHDKKTKVNLLNAGADDYIEKPFAFNELIARIKAVTRRANPKNNEDLLKIDNLELDIKRKLVSRDKRSINLRNKEFELLEYLMKNEGIVISRNTIMEKVWKYNTKVNSNTIDTHIAILRKKIDFGKSRKLIHTVHGVGYKISK